jgi:hypothetical protein
MQHRSSKALRARKKKLHNLPFLLKKIPGIMYEDLITSVMAMALAPLIRECLFPKKKKAKKARKARRIKT